MSARTRPAKSPELNDDYNAAHCLRVSQQYAAAGKFDLAKVSASPRSRAISKTRAKRLAQFMAMLEKHQKIHP